ncbi:MAG: VOC family protein [Christensenella sp.]|nr:VOC family protein [Christensenella sp.]
MGEITGLAHIGMSVEDLDRSKEFYTSVLGFEIYHECVVEGGLRVAFARLHDCRLEMVENRKPGNETAGCFGHLALKVSNIEEVRETLAERGIEFTTDEIVYAKEVFPPGGSKWILFHGPDGELLEINEVQ